MNSSLITLLSFEWADCDPDQLSSWYALREAHLEDLQACIQKFQKGNVCSSFCMTPRPYLFCLPFLGSADVFPDWMALGWGISMLPVSLNSVIIFRYACDRLHGTAVHKMSQALHARHLWKPFKVHLVPAPGGVERCPQGGYGELWVDPEGLQAPVYSIKSLTD